MDVLPIFTENYQANHRIVSFCPRGISNESKFCYFNASLQVLLNENTFLNLLRSLKDSFSENELQQLPFSRNFLLLSEELRKYGVKSRNSSPIDAREIKFTSYVSSGRFAEGVQEDASEVLHFLINKLHDEMISTTSMGISETPISSMFFGAVDRNGANTGDIFTVLPVEISHERVLTVEDALLRTFRAPQFCVAGQQVIVDRFSSLPDILLLQLKIFKFSKRHGQMKMFKKIQLTQDLTIPEQILSESLQALPLQTRKYCLTSVIYHSGEDMTYGHYTADCYHSGRKGWINYDDTHLSEVDHPNVQQNNVDDSPYILVYRRYQSNSSNKRRRRRN